MKIVILGAGIGGLYVAKELASNGYDVTVFEKRKREELGYPWFDSVKEKTFDKLNINLPPSALVPKQVLNIKSPNGFGGVKQPDRAKKNYDVDRKVLINTLLEEAEKCCEVYYDTVIDELVIEKCAVVGVKIGSTIIRTDLVIDSTGEKSKYRTQLPEGFLMNQKIKDEDIFYVKRSYFESNNELEKQESNVYMFPLGLGIAWCKESVNEKSIDVLCGNFGSLNIKQNNDILKFLKEHNSLLSEKQIFEVEAQIPVRFPLGVLAGDGYAVIGDSAFMTRPVCGSGIETTLNAAKHLVEVILKAKDFSQESLWEYSVWFMIKYGAAFSSQYVVRYLVKQLSVESIDFAFSSGLLDEGNVALATFDTPHFDKIDPKAMKKALEIAVDNGDLVKQFIHIFAEAVKGNAIALTIPLKYDYFEVKKWINKYTSFMNNLK